MSPWWRQATGYGENAGQESSSRCHGQIADLQGWKLNPKPGAFAGAQRLSPYLSMGSRTSLVLVPGGSGLLAEASGRGAGWPQPTTSITAMAATRMLKLFFIYFGRQKQCSGVGSRRRSLQDYEWLMSGRNSGTWQYWSQTASWPSYPGAESGTPSAL